MTSKYTSLPLLGYEKVESSCIFRYKNADVKRARPTVSTKKQQNTEYIYVAFHVYELYNVSLGLKGLKKKLDTYYTYAAFHLYE